MAHHGVTGVLLVGGASTRFGSPKALARLDGMTLAERAWRTLADACDERLAVGKTRDELALPFPVVDDGSPVRAPIADCPLVSAGALRSLAAAAPARPQTGPLPGAYPRSLLPELERKLERGDYALRDVEATIVELEPGELANINTEADLRRVQLL
jgi:molybdopterin-guanine dinucleotide biosynthesis protein A